MKKYFLFVAITAQFLASCSNEADEKKAVAEPKKGAPEKKEEPAPAENRRPPIINITDTLSTKQLILCIKDSAADAGRLPYKLAEIWNLKLGAILQKNKLKVTGRPTAWYKTSKAPYFFEAGIPVDKKPARLPSNAYIKEMAVDSVTVAHFYGEYTMMPMAYEALNDWLKSHKKKPDGKPYEVYVDEPRDKDGKLRDPYKVRTDVIFPWK